MSANAAAPGPVPELRTMMNETEWQARVDLAAAHRLVAYYGWTNLIYNHIALRVPDEPECFLVKRHNLLFEEVCASNLLKLRLDGISVVGEDDNVNTAGFTIHTAILQARSDLNCTLHVHTEAGMAMSAHAKGLLPINQGAMRFYNRLSYHDYEGISRDVDERGRIATSLGSHNKAMIMRNHGLLTAGVTVVEALTNMLYLVTSCRTQLMLEASGAPLVIPPPEVCEHGAQQWEQLADLGPRDEWPAYLRIADRIAPGFRS